MDLNKLLKDSSADDIKKLIGLLQAMVDEPEPTNSEPEKKQSIKTKSRTATPKQKQENKFLEMQERHMHKEDTAFQQKVSIHPPVPRDRQFEPISVKCRVCNKVEQVNPAFVDSIERYKCNTCASSAG